MANVVQSKKINVRVSSNSTSGVLNSTTPVTLKNTPSLKVGGVDRLDKLADVSAGGETDGAVPIYDSVTDKYIVKKIDLGTDVAGDLDGGTF